MKSYYCHGGPWPHAELMLDSPATLVFTAKGMTGRYRSGRAHYCQHRHDCPQFTPVAMDLQYGFDLIWEKVDD